VYEMIKLLKKFGSKAVHEDDIKTWVFEQDIKQRFMKNYTKKVRRTLQVIIVCLTSIVVLLFFTRLYYYKSISKAVEKVLFPIIIGALIGELLSRILPWLRKWIIVKKYWPIVVFPIIALVTTIVLVKIYPNNGEILYRSDVLSIYGDFLSFSGAFCLGYFIYSKDHERRIEEKRAKVRLLLAQMKKANAELLRISRLYRYGKQNHILEKQFVLEPIIVDSNWLIYYLEYESLKSSNSELLYTISSFFDNISRINIVLEKGKLESAVKINEQYIERLNYSIQKYNELEAITCLMAACDDYDFFNTESWLERKETIDLINELCRKYYLVIENYIYSWLLKHGVKTTTEEDDLERETVDWLLVNAPEIRKKIRFPSDKRIISRVVFDCSCKFTSKSKKVDYVWGEYSLK